MFYQNMEDRRTKNEHFELYFPNYHNAQWSKCDNNDEKTIFFHGEEFEIQIVATCNYDPVDNVTEVAKWKSFVQAIHPAVTLIPLLHSNIASLAEDKDFIHCKPIASYKDKLKGKWLQLNSTTLLYSLNVGFDGVTDDVSLVKLWITLWGPSVEIPEKHHLIGMKKCLEAFPDIPDEALLQDSKILHNVLASVLAVYPQPYVHYFSDNAHQTVLNLSVSNPLNSVVTIEEINLQSSSSEDLVVKKLSLSTFPLDLNPLETLKVLFELNGVLFEECERELSLYCVVTWRCKNLISDAAITKYSMGQVRITKPPISISGQIESTPTVGKPFCVTYTIENNLQDFLSVRLIWGPERALAAPAVLRSAEARQQLHHLQESVICHHPTSHLGAVSKGSKLNVPITFTARAPGVYELGQHMRLNLQYYNRNSHTSLNVEAKNRSINGSPKHFHTQKKLDSPLPRHRRTSSLSPMTEAALRDHHHHHRGASGDFTHNNFKGANIDHFHHIGSPVHKQKFLTPNRSQSQTTSPISPKHLPLLGPAVVPSQVLKKKCLVYVTKDL